LGFCECLRIEYCFVEIIELLLFPTLVFRVEFVQKIDHLAQAMQFAENIEAI
jgi:hypothetical protein